VTFIEYVSRRGFKANNAFVNKFIMYIYFVCTQKGLQAPVLKRFIFLKIIFSVQRVRRGFMPQKWGD
jgi:hypothetical protein